MARVERVVRLCSDREKSRRSAGLGTLVGHCCLGGGHDLGGSATLMTAALCLVVCLNATLIEEAERSERPTVLSPRAICRHPARDGANCLYLQLRMMGHAGSYASLIESAPDIERC